MMLIRYRTVLYTIHVYLLYVLLESLFLGKIFFRVLKPP
jgi:hypothetical protein